MWTPRDSILLPMTFGVVLTLLCFPLFIESGGSTRKVFVNYSGDIILGALFPVHRRGSGSEISCDKIQLEDGIQPLEAMLYTVDKINRNESILPGIKIGVLALDTCDSAPYALEQSLDFIKGFIAHSNEHHVTEFECSDGSPARSVSDAPFNRVVGVIGGQSSSVSIQIAYLLRLFQVPQISYMSTSPQLSNRDRFPYFFRTVPSDVTQAHAILDILRHFHWTYVAVIYSDSEYGIHCYETLRDVAVNDTICFTTPQRVIRDQFQTADYEQIIRNINALPDIKVIILILEKEYTKEIIRAAARLDVRQDKKYVWIVTDAWSLRESVVLGLEDTVEGAIAIQPLVSHVEGFDEYFKQLRPSPTQRNPWFDEYWETYFHCRLPGVPPTKFNEEYNSTTCGSDLRISSKNGYRQHAFIHFVRDAVYAFVTALNNMHMDLCGGRPGLCYEMRHIDGPQLVKYLANVTFKDEEDLLFRFMNGGDGPTRYTIVNFQRFPLNGTYKWTQVGNYSISDSGKLELKLERSVRYRLTENGTYPSSNCAEPCAPEEIKVRERDESCCWKCRPCSSYAIKIDDFHCDECLLGFIPDKSHAHCLPIPEEYIDYRNPWAIAAMGVATFGILITVFVGLVFWSYNDTPIIKAAGRELSYILLLGILLSFSVTFFIVAEPNGITCGIMRFFLGFCPTLCYAAIVTKTNRIARIFHPKPCNSAPKTKYISPRSQMIIVGLLTAVDLLINAVWIYWDPPRSTWIYPNREMRLKICEGLDTYSYMVGFIYPMILIGFCTIYAIQTRKCPGGFNETKYIAFTNYTIIIIWLAFVPLYIASTSNSIRVVTLAISLSLSGLVELSCLFFPKLYIVLCKPEKNTKEVVMAPNRNSFVTLSNATSHGAPTSLLSQEGTRGESLQSNGKYKKKLYPGGILTNGNISEPSCSE